MVYLSRIYTKTGDSGQTGLGDGQRVSKDHPRVAAYGDVDELNAVMGLLHAHMTDGPERDLIRLIQNDLFDVGADLCVPLVAGETGGLRILPTQYERLEKAIDLYNDRLTPLKSFILPGGSIASAWLHLARTVCRRAERSIVTMLATEAINPAALIYLNRLSDLLFVLGRIANANGTDDVLWVPGASRSGS
jgi:cob(I)alamin adenosyltransferase